MNQLFAGIDRKIITPEVGARLYGYSDNLFSTCVNDDLHVTAIYFEDCGKKLLLICAEVCLVDNELSDIIRNRIAGELNLDVNNIILTATHTHSGPCTKGFPGWGDRDEEYCRKIFLPQILAAAQNAVKNTKPVSMGVGSVNSKVGINRRELDEENQVLLGQNPWGCYDPKMTVVAFQSGGKPYFNLVHYSCHGTAAGVHTEITRDWSGIMIDRLEAETGAMTVYLQGAEGDVGPRLSNGMTAGDLSYMNETGCIAALDAMNAYRSISVFRMPELHIVSGEITIPYKKMISRTEAEKKLEQAMKNSPSNMNQKYCSYLKDVLLCYACGEPEKKQSVKRQTILKIGDLLLVPSSFELFSEFSLRMKKYLKTDNLLILGCSNGSDGYFPTQSELIRGGYEVASFRMQFVQEYADDAEKYYIQGNLGLIRKIGDNI